MKHILVMALMYFSTGAVNLSFAVEDRLIQAAEEQLSAQFPQATFAVEVRWLPSRLHELLVSQQIDRLRFPGHEIPKGLVTTKVLSGRETYTIQLFVQTRIEIPVLNQTAERGDVITKEMISHEKIDITHYKRLPISQIRYGEQMPRRALKQGVPLYDTDLILKPALGPGDQVVMKYSVNGFVIEINCETRQAGATGELITIHCSESGKRYQAIVLKEGNVEWRRTL
ncbi:MAG: flagellar basal body P-ring formation chaperone FlgA [Balneolales bacterium]